MASQALTAPPDELADQLHPLLPPPGLWQKWLSGALSVALIGALGWKLHGFGFAAAWASLPPSPLFWAAFAAYYLALPSSEWLIFRRLWRIPLSGFAALLRKLISNEIILGYSGEVYFYVWARRRVAMAAAPFGAIKDVSILSAVAGNMMTLAMLAASWPWLRALSPALPMRAVALSAAAILGLSLALLAFRNRVFSMPGHQLRAIFAIHIARLVATTILSGLMWHSALPQVALGSLVALATLQLLVTRLPFVPNKDLAFAAIAIFFIGHDGSIGVLIAMIATLILAVHLGLGLVLTAAELAGWHGR